METLDVPEVRQLPELSANEESPVAFAAMVLTSLLGYHNALLYAEFIPEESSVGWYIKSHDTAVVTRDVEVGISPTLGSFRSVLAQFAHHYMRCSPYNGYALRFLQQHSRIKRCDIYLSNCSQSGFWIRVYGTQV